MRKLCGNCVFPQNFHTRKLGEITVFYAVTFLNEAGGVRRNQQEKGMKNKATKSVWQAGRKPRAPQRCTKYTSDQDLREAKKQINTMCDMILSQNENQLIIENDGGQDVLLSSDALVEGHS